MRHNARVLAQLLAAAPPELPRVVHHAVAAGDDAVVVAEAPRAAEEAYPAGSHAQEIRFYEELLRRRTLLATEAQILQACATARFTTDRIADALEASTAAVEIREQLGDPGELATALAGLAPILWALTRPHEAVATSERAVNLLADDGDTARHAWTLRYNGLLLTGVDRYAEALSVGAAAVGMAERIGSAALLGLAQGLHGRARFHLGDEAGHDEMCHGIATAAAVPHHQHVLMTYISLVQELWLRGRDADVERRAEEGIAYGREHDLDFYLDYLLGHRLRLLVVRGDWVAAEAGLRAMLAAGDGGSGSGAGAARHSLPTLAQLLVRRGADDAPTVLARAVDYARRADSRYELVPALLAEIEQAWLLDRAAARAAVATLTERTVDQGAERQRGELLRRLGEDVEAFLGCPDELAAGIRGDWRAAAEAWRAVGDPYAAALELAEGDTEAGSPRSPSSTTSAPGPPPRGCGGTCAARASR
jgi:tetratricopeptide (TPR) repeat protein